MCAPLILLVHGAWADGSSWRKIIPILLGQGLRVTAVQLPLTSLADDVAATQRALALVDGPVLMVGHSYGGAVITNAGNDAKVVGLVYVAAFAPGEGEAVGELGKAFPPPPGLAELRPDAHGFVSMTVQGVLENFAQDLPAEEGRLMHAVQTPTHGSTFGAPTGQPAWKTRPSWYVVATEDRMILPALQRQFVERLNASTLTLPASHVPMLSHPGEVAEFIDRAARQLRSPK
ncbi:alpha/beta hydrolase [Mitsuaria sp. CC2]|uniref:alpha/beta fold hydrolase n=1 Tax=Mitsuaria sp. CC2 TaxID=3029186 RepID=UPI003B8BBB77